MSKRPESAAVKTTTAPAAPAAGAAVNRQPARSLRFQCQSWSLTTRHPDTGFILLEGKAGEIRTAPEGSELEKMLRSGGWTCLDDAPPTAKPASYRQFVPPPPTPAPVGA